MRDPHMFYCLLPTVFYYFFSNQIQMSGSGEQHLSDHLVKDHNQLKNLIDKDELGTIQKTKQVQNKQKETCSSCKKDITDQIIKIDNRNFHVKCFTCHNCKKQLEQTYHISGTNFLCSFCFKNGKN